MGLIMDSTETIYVRMEGNDENPGTRDEPVKSLHEAQSRVRAMKATGKENIMVIVGGGTYYLDKPLVFSPEDSGTLASPISWMAEPGEAPVISGGRMLTGEWTAYKDGIVQLPMPGNKAEMLDFSELFVNGERQHRARFPDYDENDPGVRGSGYLGLGDISSLFGTKLPKFLEDDRLKQQNRLAWPNQGPLGFNINPSMLEGKHWRNLKDIFLHIFPNNYWGNLIWKLDDIDYEDGIIWLGEGGWHINSKDLEAGQALAIGSRSRFYFDNVFEELDAPKEWYLDKDQGILYYYPPDDLDINKAQVVASLLKQVIEFRGSRVCPVCNITISGFTITNSRPVFHEPYEKISAGDWTINRSGAIFLEGAENIRVQDCFFDHVGGNAIFLNAYNRWNHFSGNTIIGSGDSAFCLVGDDSRTMGTNCQFPADNEIFNNHITRIGYYVKQVAGIFGSIHARTIVAHNYIHHVPRAAICLNDCWFGGHVIEFNKSHDTVQETSDHGGFNSWGRTRYWCLCQSHLDASHGPGRCEEDIGETIIIRNNYLRDFHGFGIDLDDGSSFEDVYNNLCIGCAIKLREGTGRRIHNNIIINPAQNFGFHQGLEKNSDRIWNNIIVKNGDCQPGILTIPESFRKVSLNPSMEGVQDWNCAYELLAAPRNSPFAAECNKNLFWMESGKFCAIYSMRDKPRKEIELDEWQELGFDTEFVIGDPLFNDAEHGDYRVQPGSPALKLGFENFPMDHFGLTADFKGPGREVGKITDVDM